MPPWLESIVIVSVLVVLIVFGAVLAFLAIVRRSISASGQTVTPCSVDYWIYLSGAVLAFALGLFALSRYFFL